MCSKVKPSFALIVCMICVYQQAANGAPTHSSVSSSRQPDSNDHTHSSNVRVVSSRTSAQKRALDSKMMSTDALSSNQPTYKPEISSHPSSPRSINDVEFDGTDVPNEYTAPKKAISGKPRAKSSASPSSAQAPIVSPTSAPGGNVSPVPGVSSTQRPDGITDAPSLRSSAPFLDAPSSNTVNPLPVSVAVTGQPFSDHSYHPSTPDVPTSTQQPQYVSLVPTCNYNVPSVPRSTPTNSPDASPPSFSLAPFSGTVIPSSVPADVTGQPSCGYSYRPSYASLAPTVIPSFMPIQSMAPYYVQPFQAPTPIPLSSAPTTAFPVTFPPTEKSALTSIPTSTEAVSSLPSFSWRPSIEVFPDFSGLPSCPTLNPSQFGGTSIAPSVIGETALPSRVFESGNAPSVISKDCLVAYPQWVGDGWCDSSNGLGVNENYNTPECTYDGGDCCETTCESTLKNECGTVAFVCIDPSVVV